MKDETQSPVDKKQIDSEMRFQAYLIRTLGAVGWGKLGHAFVIESIHASPEGLEVFSCIIAMIAGYVSLGLAILSRLRGQRPEWWSAWVAFGAGLGGLAGFLYPGTLRALLH